MTRINCIDPSLLTDQHLFIEFREITRVRNLARPLKNYGQYILGEGHVKFFYNKATYLAVRLEAIQAEMDKRDIWNYQYKEYGDHGQLELNQDWTPDAKAQLANLIRLDSKVREQPNFYKFYGKPINDDFYLNQIVKLTTSA